MEWILSASIRAGIQSLAVNMDGCYIDLMEGEYIINVLEPKRWEEDSGSVLPRHISFLRDFFRAYKDFTSAEIECAGNIS